MSSLFYHIPVTAWSHHVYNDVSCQCRFPLPHYHGLLGFWWGWLMRLTDANRGFKPSAVSISNAANPITWWIFFSCFIRILCSQEEKMVCILKQNEQSDINSIWGQANGLTFCLITLTSYNFQTSQCQVFLLDFTVFLFVLPGWERWLAATDHAFVLCLQLACRGRGDLTQISGLYYTALTQMWRHYGPDGVYTQGQGILWKMFLMSLPIFIQNLWPPSVITMNPESTLQYQVSHTRNLISDICCGTGKLNC